MSATVVEDLRRFDNQDYLNELRASPDFTGLRGDLDRLTACLAEPGLEVTAKAFKGLIDTARGDLDLFQDGVHPGKRLALTLATLVFYPLPFTVAAFQGDLLYATRAQSNYARSTSSVLGMLYEPVADFRLFYQHTQERLWPFVAPGAIYAGPAFAESLHHLRHSGPFAGYAAAGTAASLFLATYGQDEIRALKARLNPVLTGTAPTTAQLRTTLGEILDDMEGRLTRIDQLLEGKKVSDNLSAELLFMRKDWGALSAAMRKIVFPSGQAAIAEVGRRRDRRRSRRGRDRRRCRRGRGCDRNRRRLEESQGHEICVCGHRHRHRRAQRLSRLRREGRPRRLRRMGRMGGCAVVRERCRFRRDSAGYGSPLQEPGLGHDGRTSALDRGFRHQGGDAGQHRGLVASMVSLTVTNLTISGKIGTWLAQALLALLPIVIAGATFCFQCGGARNADKGKGRAVETDPDDAVAVSEPGYVLGNCRSNDRKKTLSIWTSGSSSASPAGASGSGLGKSGSTRPVAGEGRRGHRRRPSRSAFRGRRRSLRNAAAGRRTRGNHRRASRPPSPDAEDTRSATPPPSQKDR